jgi:hypothetical protein
MSKKAYSKINKSRGGQKGVEKYIKKSSPLKYCKSVIPYSLLF